YNEFFKPAEIQQAKELLKQGGARAQGLRAGKPDWIHQTGLVVRGYVSQLDDSVQPYGLVVPATYQPNLPFHYRLDVWLHGRSETLSELNFIVDRQKNAGQFTPANAFVLHPYGRYCNAYKFAGEVDVIESLAAARQAYPVDANRISLRGFSMGGGGTWHLGVHYADWWTAIAPGAGFAETAEYQKLKPENVPWYERKLWHWYDATDYAVNLFNSATVAYSGEIDRQIQAAQVMARELKREGLELTHIIGPKTEHKYHPDSITEINHRVDNIVAAGRHPLPRVVKFSTWTLRYDTMHWVTVDALAEHWGRARVEAEIKDASSVVIKTQNVTALTLAMPAGLCPLDQSRAPQVTLDGQTVTAAPVTSDRSWTAHFLQVNGKWIRANSADDGTLRKRHGLQGPIDDALLSRFVMVRPTGQPLHAATGTWAQAEFNRAVTEWRKLFRGEAPVKDDSAITEADIADSNLILWGDPASNKLLAQMLLAKTTVALPFRWDAQTLKLGELNLPANQHMPLLVFPNPLNPKRYVVLNSGFTFREDSNATNSRQTPRLPDWAVVDITVPPTYSTPGRIVSAGFFGERWEWNAPPKP
ncbi:MAG: hypothetical protein HOP19_17670, partial [Acidobacteria bacterium]|nr:hypothetical protein [Acidobacteriota bacterium]